MPVTPPGSSVADAAGEPVPSGIRSGRSPHRGATVGFLVTLALVEGLARSGFFVDRPVPLALTAMHHKSAWLQAQPSAAIVIAGDSTANRDVDAKLFGEVIGQRTLNIAFTSGSPIVMRFMLTHCVQPPKTIVYGIFPVGLSDDWAVAPHEVDAASLGERMALIDKGEAMLGTVWASYRRRTAIGDWLAGHWRAPLVDSEGPEDAWGSTAVELPPQVSLPLAEALWQRWGVADPPRTGARMQALQALATEWQARGTQVVYVLMPMTSQLRQVEARKPATAAFALASLHAVADPHGSLVVDARAAVPDAGFYDVDHLGKGAWRDAFTRQLAAAVQDRRAEFAPVRLADQ